MINVHGGRIFFTGAFRRDNELGRDARKKWWTKKETYIRKETMENIYFLYQDSYAIMKLK